MRRGNFLSFCHSTALLENHSSLKTKPLKTYNGLKTANQSQVPQGNLLWVLLPRSPIAALPWDYDFLNATPDHAPSSCMTGCALYPFPRHAKAQSNYQVLEICRRKSVVNFNRKIKIQPDQGYSLCFS